MANPRPIATLLAANFSTAFSAFFGTHNTLRTGKVKLIVVPNGGPTHFDDNRDKPRV